MKPSYDLEKIKLTIDEPTWNRAIDLYESGAVNGFTEEYNNYYAKVKGSQIYSVIVSGKNYNSGRCDCYLGKNNTLCKHMIAVAIMATVGGRKLSDEEKELNNEVKSSDEIRELSQMEIENIQDKIKEASKYIKAYMGPSKYWFQYQDSLIEGCNLLAKIVSKMPICEKSAEIIVNLCIKLDRKLTAGGVDDSDGVVGGFIQECVEVLKNFVKQNKNCAKTFTKLHNIETCFGWEEELVKIADKKLI